MKSMSKLNAGKVISGRLKLALLLMITGSLEIASFSSAKAQMINPFGVNNRATLGKEDYRLALEAVGKLLNEKPPTVGRYDTWSNTASGNHGRFTILDIFMSNGMPCRKVKSYVVYSRAGTTPRSFTLNVCKLQNGEWKTVA
jgi:surface antigen